MLSLNVAKLGKKTHYRIIRIHLFALFNSLRQIIEEKNRKNPF